ncbi:hypothetical protein MgSA37_00437 [Mucilaginibacter gotjawali]|nr:hypothetical protein MgSA37_00437 [Mucilaginibacter gotjawali]
MQDKEMDELFRSQLEGFEMEPSANVWPAIAAEINPANKKTILTPFLSVAASIVVLVGAGLLFIPQKEAVKSKGQVTPVVVKAPPSVKRVSLIAAAPLATSKPVIENRIANIAMASHKKAATNSIVTTIDSSPKPAINIQPAQQQAIANVPKQLPARAVVPDNATPLIAKQAPDQVTDYIAQAQIAALPVKPAQKDTTAVKTRRSIHSFGDLVNVLVAKVDKRRDKIIEFSADDDGESHLTGVNLGIIKIKKRE